MKSINITTFNRNSFVLNSVKIIRELIQDLTQNYDEINIALSGGNSPLPIYKKLATTNLDWEKINFFIVDERCVPNSDPQSNYGNIKKHLFDYIPSRNFPIVDSKSSYYDLANKYEAQIREHLKVVNGLPQFDLLILGMGLDGHTASLFPVTKALNENEKLVVLNDIPQLQVKRITMTYPLILNSNKIVLIAKGEHKKKLLDTISENDYPISQIMPQIHLILN